MALVQPVQDRVLLTISVSTVTKTLVPASYERFERSWVLGHTCMDLLELLLRRHHHSELANSLTSTDVVIQMKCARSIGVLNSSLGTKRARHLEEMICTTFLHDNLLETLQTVDSDELFFYLEVPQRPEPNRDVHVVDATQRLLQAATSAARPALPPRLSHRRMNGDHHVYNAILDYLGDEGVGWSERDLPSGKQFLDHVSKAFWVLTPKARKCSRLPYSFVAESLRSPIVLNHSDVSPH